MRQFYQCLVIGLALALSAAASLPAASAAPAVGTVTGSVYTHGSERGMKIASAPDASAGGISWDLAAPKNKFHDKEADVWLIGRDFTYDELSDKEIDDWYRFGKIPANTPIYHTETDKKTGKYEFHDIPKERISSSSSTAMAAMPRRISPSLTTSSGCARSCQTGNPSSSSTSDHAAASCRWSRSNEMRQSP